MDRTSVKLKEQKQFKFKFTRSYFKVLLSLFLNLKKFTPDELIQAGLRYKRVRKKIMKTPGFILSILEHGYLSVLSFVGQRIPTEAAIKVADTLLAEKAPRQSESFYRKKEALLKWCEGDIAVAQHVLSHDGWDKWITLGECDRLLEKNPDLKKWMKTQEELISQKKTKNVVAPQGGSVLSDLSTRPPSVEIVVSEHQPLLLGIPVLSQASADESLIPTQIETIVPSNTQPKPTEAELLQAELTVAANIPLPAPTEAEIMEAELAVAARIALPAPTETEMIEAELAAWDSSAELSSLFENHDAIKEWFYAHGDSIFQEKADDAVISEHEKKIVLFLCKKNAERALSFLGKNTWSDWFTPTELLDLIAIHPSLHEWFNAHRSEIIPIENLGGLTPRELYVCANASEQLAEEIVVSEYFDKLTPKHCELLSKKYEDKRVYHLIEVMTTSAGAIDFITPCPGNHSDTTRLAAYSFLESFRTASAPFYKRLVEQVAESAELEWVPSSAFKRLIKLHPECLIEVFRHPKLLKRIPLNELKSTLRAFQTGNRVNLSYFQALQTLWIAAYHQPETMHPIYQLENITFPNYVVTADSNMRHVIISDEFAKSVLRENDGIPSWNKIYEKYLALEVLSSKELVRLLYPKDFKERCALYLSIPSRAQYEALNKEQKVTTVAGNHEIQSAYFASREAIYNVKDIADAVCENDPLMCIRIAELIQRPECSLEFLPKEYHPHLKKPKYWYDKAMLGLRDTYQACLPLAVFYQQQAEAEKNPKIQQQLWRQVRELCIKAFELSPESTQKNQARLMLAKLYEDNRIKFSKSEIAEYEAETGESSVSSEYLNGVYAFEAYSHLLEQGCADSVIYFLQYWQSNESYLELLRLCQRTLEMDFKFSEDQHYELHGALVTLLGTIYNQLPKDAQEQVALRAENEAALKTQVRALYEACVAHGQQSPVKDFPFSRANSGLASNMKTWLGIQNAVQALPSEVPQLAQAYNAEAVNTRPHCGGMYQQFISKKALHQELFSAKAVAKRFKRT